MNQSKKAGARFTLRKRSIRHNSDGVHISTYNSDFLNGIFADVAKISELSDSEGSLKRGPGHLGANPSDDEPSHIVYDSPYKKRCTALNRSISRSRCSIMNLADLDDVQAPSAKPDFSRSSTDLDESMSPGFDEIQPVAKPSLKDHTHHDSLAFQLGCVAGLDSNTTSTDAAAGIAFPNLPASVSDSSCSAGLTRVNLIKQASSPEKKLKESFGWFVDLDDNQSSETRGVLSYSVSSGDLPFQAPTAPKRHNNDAEVEWAKAADTVDDVLGDFF